MAAISFVQSLLRTMMCVITAYAVAFGHMSAQTSAPGSTSGGASTGATRGASPSPQTSAPRPAGGATTTTSPQRDATRPPGTEQRQPTPEQARPSTQDPTAPPGTARPAPQAVPGTTLTPQNTLPAAPGTTTLPNRDATTPGGAAPATSATPTAPAGAGTPGNIPPTPDTGSAGSGESSLREPRFPTIQPRPVPPMPSLTRLGVTGDKSLTLSLNEAIRRALENNNEIEVARNDVRFAESLLRSLEGFYDPVLSLEPQYDSRVQSQPSRLGGSNQSGNVTTNNFSLSPALNKSFSVGGGQYQLFFNNNRQTTSSTFNTLNPVYSASLGVQFTQPLWRDRSIDRTRRDIRIQRKRLEQSDADFRQRTIDVIAQVQRAYWDMVFALRDQQNRIANVNLTRELFRTTEARIAAGATAPLERAEVQTELSNRESDLLIASQNVSIAENNLKQLMLRDPLAGEWSAQIVPTDVPSFDTTPVILANALTEARANRPELRRLRVEQEVSDIDTAFLKNQTRPRIDIQSTVATTGLAGTPIIATGTLTDQDLPIGTSTGQVPLIFGNPETNSNAFLLTQLNQLRLAQGLAPVDSPLVTPQSTNLPSNFIGGYRRTLSNVFGFDTRNIVVGVAIQIPLRNRTAEANLASANIQRTQLEASTRLQEQAVEVDVRNSAQAVETSRQRVLSARAARENAELQLTGEQRLYQVGRGTTFLLFQRENQLVNARNLELRAETDYNKALADLQRATSTTLRANNVIVEVPTTNGR